MRKIFMLATMFVMIFCCTAFAAQTTKVVIISGAEFKTQDFYKLVQKNLGTKTKTLYDCGDEVQKNFKVFMMDRYDIGENNPLKQDLIDFAARYNYSRTLFLMIEEKEDKQNSSNHRQKNRSTIQLDAYLVADDRIADFTTTSQDFVSKASNLRARRGAFEKGLKEIAKVMNLN